MSATHQDTKEHLERLVGGLSPDEIARRLTSKHHDAPPRVPGATHTEPAIVEKRWALLPHAASVRASIADPISMAQAEHFASNIENFVGTVKLPVGLAGPLRINGTAAQ